MTTSSQTVSFEWYVIQPNVYVPYWRFEGIERRICIEPNRISPLYFDYLEPV